MISRKYPTIFTRDYVSDWTPANALREIVQNCLDSPSTFEYDLSGDSLIFTSKGTKLHQSTLLLGNSTKRDDINTVGGKGEGYKLACVILLREGHDVVIRNGDLIWTPQFEYSELFEAEVMVFVETSGSGNDLTFEISGATQDLIDEVKEDCLYLQTDLGRVWEGSRGRVFPDIHGKLYVGGLFVCNYSGMKYTYDFKPQYLPLNRDRKSVDGWKLTENTTKLLEEVAPASELALLSQENNVDSGGYYTRFYNQEVAEESYKLFKEKNGELAVVARDEDEKEVMEKRGYKNVKVVYNEKVRNLIKDSVEYINFIDELDSVVEPPEEDDTRSPIEILEDWWEDNEIFNELPTDTISEFKKLLDLFKEKGVEWQ